MNKQAALFFGSGISFPSGVPSVYEITSSALTGKWHKHTNQIFYAGLPPGQTVEDEVTSTVKGFLVELSDCAADYIAECSRNRISRKPHYEDLFSLAEQASRIATDHMPNLAVVEFLRHLRTKTARYHCGFKGGTTGLEGFEGLASTACDFLHCVVQHHLHSAGNVRHGLELISKVASEVDALDIFTLNHDLLIENQLKDDGIDDVEIGFGDNTHGEFLVFNGWPKNFRHKVRLFKLHGSLDWYLYNFPGWARQYAVSQNHIWHGRDEKGRIVTPVEGKAAFLSGTVVKEQQYGLGLWGELFSAFREHLSHHTHLICCGYGFGDTGINQRLQQWRADRLDGSNRIVILTPDIPETYLVDKPLWLRLLYEEGNVTFVGQYLESCTLDDLIPYFDDVQ